MVGIGVCERDLVMACRLFSCAILFRGMLIVIIMSHEDLNLVYGGITVALPDFELFMAWLDDLGGGHAAVFVGLPWITLGSMGMGVCFA